MAAGDDPEVIKLCVTDAPTKSCDSLKELQNNDMKKSVLLFGGSSEERLVSVASAQNLAIQYEFSETCFLLPEGFLSSVSKDELLNHRDDFQAEFKAQQKPFLRTSQYQERTHNHNNRYSLGFSVDNYLNSRSNFSNLFRL